MAGKRTIQDLPLSGRRLLVRVDFNVPLDADGAVADDRRIQAALPTLEYALARDASLVLMSHLGRPGGQVDEKLRLAGVAECLSRHLGDSPLQVCREVIGEEVSRRAEALRPGEVLLLENLRFHPGEKQGDDALGRALAGLADAYVNDAFATCHRSHASMVAAARHFDERDRAVGLLVESELAVLDRIREGARDPLVLLIGGAKVEDKIGMIESLGARASRVLVGGRSAWPFLAERGLSLGAGQADPETRETAARLIEKLGDQLVLPEDHVVEREGEGEPAGEVREVREIPEGWQARDIGPDTVARFCEQLTEAGTVVWSGPLGAFEDDRFEAGTRAVAECLAHGDADAFVGGGETAQAVTRFGFADAMEHVSTGGGAFLAGLSGEPLPALEVIPSQSQ